MQEREKEQAQTLAPADPKSEPFPPVLVVQAEALDDDPDEIFFNAVAEIDTQPLISPRIPYTWGEVVAHLACLLLIIGGMAGIVWQAITYPKTLVIVYAVEKPVSLTTTLAVATRTLAPVTLTRSATIPTTGHGHQDGKAASGILTFYNGNVGPQTVAGGTVFTGSDGVQVATDQAVTIPAANPPYLGQATMTASTLRAGSAGNIRADDMNGTVSSSVFVKNLAAFTRGRDARTYQAVAQQDIQNATSTLQATLVQAMPLAFPVAPGESVYPTYCMSTATPDHHAGDEARTVTVQVAYTCQGSAYNSQELAHQATAAFTKTRPAPRYHVIGSVQTKLINVSPVSVNIHGSWVYTFSAEYEQYLAQQIAGDTPAQARTYLLSTGVISQANVPSTLPVSMYIQFVVLVG
jgi:hypothetical protein